MKIITHGGLFHGDEIFAIAALELIFSDKKIKIERKFDVLNEELEDNKILVLDIGGQFDRIKRNFDHHQKTIHKIGDTEISHSAFSLVWEEFATRKFSIATYNAILHQLAIPVSGIDNNEIEKKMDSISTAISGFNPSWEVTDSQEKMNCFRKAIDFARTVLSNAIAYQESIEKGENLVCSAVVQDHILILPQFAPWQGAIRKRPEEILYAMFPGRTVGSWNIQTVSKKESREPIKPLPKEWLDKLPDGCTFVHKGRFLAAFETQESAFEAVKKL
jgi:uncharacterized UPF0160 family protein